MKDVSEVADERSWWWIRAGYLGKCMERYVTKVKIFIIG